MANRFCDGCGSKMSPRWPRKRMPHGEMWCPACVLNRGRNLTTASATWGPEDAIRFELGRQKVRMVTERAGGTSRPLCDYHTSVAAQRAGLADSITRGTGIRDENERSPFTVHPSATEGRCADCVGEQKKTMPWAGGDRPRHAPPEQQETSPMPPSEFHRGGWPYRPRNSYERSAPVPATPYSLNSRVAVRVAQGPLPEDASGTQKLAHFIAWDRPDIVKCAHDSGDSTTIFHCPFCGSGQVIARSDGTTECEFCHSAFTVQVQPQFSAFPQTIDGVPVDVPGMPSNTAMPPGADPNAVPPEDGEIPPEGDEPPADGESDDGGDDKPAFLKGSYRTATGATLQFDAYVRHLAITCAPDREAALNRVRATR